MTSVCSTYLSCRYTSCTHPHCTHSIMLYNQIQPLHAFAALHHLPNDILRDLLEIFANCRIFDLRSCRCHQIDCITDHHLITHFQEPYAPILLVPVAANVIRDQIHVIFSEIAHHFDLISSRSMLTLN